MMTRAACALILVILTSGADLATAEELSSASYRHLGGSVSGGTAAGARALVSSASSATYASSDVTIGSFPTSAPSGSLGTLASILPGFWSIVVGGFPTLDLDGDLAQYFLDEDDDGDGLDDVVETGTGFFVSASNTGTSPTSADTDGDGFDDGTEVQAGSDPNNPASVPVTPQVPSLAWPLRMALVALLGMVALASLRVTTGRRRALSS